MIVATTIRPFASTCIRPVVASPPKRPRKPQQPPPQLPKSQRQPRNRTGWISTAAARQTGSWSQSQTSAIRSTNSPPRGNRKKEARKRNDAKIFSNFFSSLMTLSNVFVGPSELMANATLTLKQIRFTLFIIRLTRLALTLGLSESKTSRKAS